jgi:hypothetical protein
MVGYGYSLWLVPQNWRDIKRIYSMKHIPHITVCTNMDRTDPVILSISSFKVHTFSYLKKFPKMYKNDPLDASGFYCKIEGICTNHTPHMSVSYSHDDLENLAPPDSLECQLHFANTQSDKPHEWYLL